MGEVISVVQRRRRWTVEQKLALVGEAMRPGSSVAGVADRHGVSRSLVFEWRRQMREGTMPGVVCAEAASALVSVRVVEERPPQPLPRPPGLSREPANGLGQVATIEVVLRNGRVLRVMETIRPEALGRLAAALEA